MYNYCITQLWAAVLKAIKKKKKLTSHKAMTIAIFTEVELLSDKMWKREHGLWASSVTSCFITHIPPCHSLNVAPTVQQPFRDLVICRNSCWVLSRNSFTCLQKTKRTDLQMGKKHLLSFCPNQNQSIARGKLVLYYIPLSTMKYWLLLQHWTLQNLTPITF